MYIFKSMCTVRKQGDLLGRLNLFVNDIGGGSLSTNTFFPFRKDIIPAGTLGKDLRHCGIRTSRAAGVSRDTVSNGAGQTPLPGGPSGGSVALGSAVFSYDVIEVTSVIVGK